MTDTGDEPSRRPSCRCSLLPLEADSLEDICTPGWPERQLARTMQAMRGNGWSIEGLARVFALTPAGVEL